MKDQRPSLPGASCDLDALEKWLEDYYPEFYHLDRVQAMAAELRQRRAEVEENAAWEKHLVKKLEIALVLPPGSFQGLTLAAASTLERLSEKDQRIAALEAEHNDRLKSPCGHWAAYAWTEDGGKHIVCLVCEVAALHAQITAREQEIGRLRYYAAHDELCRCGPVAWQFASAAGCSCGLAALMGADHV